jgi:serine protease Do
MSSRKTTLFYVVLVAVASLAVGMVLASRLDLSPRSEAQTLTPQVGASTPVSGAIDAQTFRNIAKVASPTVVNIRTTSKRRAQSLSDFFGGDDPFNRFFRSPQQQQPREETTQATGTGFIISKDGYILTNNHVVEGATKIEVALFGDDADQVYLAKIVGRDQLTDSALIQLIDKPKAPLAEAKLGDSDQVAPGDWVMAIGNPFNLSHTVSVGVISGLARPLPIADGRYEDVFQTDAAINPGNSGGPLLNIRGEVIGINTAIISDGGRAGNIGIGFTVPINTIRNILPQLQAGKVVRGRIGVSVQNIPRDSEQDLGVAPKHGALARTVTANGPAARAGIKPGDVITEFNGKPVTDRESLVKLVMATKPGTTVPIKIVHEKQTKTLSVEIEELDLEAESGQSAQAESEDSGGGFGITLGSLGTDMARRLQVPAGTKGVLVTAVEDSGAAAAAGIRAGDVILQVNRKPVESVSEASRALQAIRSGSNAFLLIFRQGEEQFVVVTKE